MLLSNRIDAINATIESYLQDIQILQAKVTHLQSHAQEVAGAQQAAESALAQIDTAIAMLTAICPDEIATFQAAIEAKFSAPLPQLEAGKRADTIEADIPAPPEPSAPEAIETTAVVVETSEPEEESVVENPAAPTNGAAELDGNGNGHYLTYDELRGIKRPTLIKLANQHKIAGYKSMKQNELAIMLDGLVSPEELEQINATAAPSKQT